MKIKQAVILAGGKGVRLLPHTLNKQKAMVPVPNRPFLEYLMDLFKKNGLTEIVILLGYKPESVISYFGDGGKQGLKITYSVEPAEINNGTRIRNAMPLLDKVFLLSYCDIYWPIDIRRHIAVFKKNNLPAMMTVFHNKRDGQGEYPIGNVKVSANNIIEYYGEFKDHPSYQGNDLGFYIIKKSLLKKMPKKDFLFQDFVADKLVRKRLISAYITDGPYATITNEDWLKKAEIYFRNI